MQNFVKMLLIFIFASAQIIDHAPHSVAIAYSQLALSRTQKSTVDRADRVSRGDGERLLYLQGYLGCCSWWSRRAQEGSWQPGRYFRCGRNRYKRVIAAGLMEEDKDSLGAGRTSTVLRGPSLCRPNRPIHVSKFRTSYFRKIRMGAKSCTMQKFPAVRYCTLNTAM